MSGVSSSTDFSNCTSFGGRNADPVETGTDGVEVVDGRPGVCCCGFFRSGVSSGGLLPGFDGLPPGFDGLSFGVDGLPPGVGFGGVLSGRVGVGFGGVLSGRLGVGGLLSGFETVGGGFGDVCGLRALPRMTTDRPKWNRWRWHMSEPYLSTQGCCGTIALYCTIT